jgi:hypothetical protein
MIAFKIQASTSNPGYFQMDIYHKVLDMTLFSRFVTKEELQQLREELANVSKSGGADNIA